MDRRDFMKTVGVAGGAAALPGLLGGLAGNAGAASTASVSQSREAMLELLATIDEVQARLLSPEAGVNTPDEIAEGERALAHILQTALFFWLEADPNAPSSFNATEAEYYDLLERGFELLWDDPEGSTFVVSIVAIVTSIVFRIVTTFLWIPHCASCLSRAYAARGSKGSRRGEADSSSELQPEPEPDP